MSNSELSGRAVARQYRQKQKAGKTAVASGTNAAATQTVSSAKPSVNRPTRRPVNSVVAPASAGGREAAKQRREQLKSGKTRQSQGTPNPHPKAKAKQNREPIVEPRKPEEIKKSSRRASRKGLKVNVNSQQPAQLSGRNVAKAYRKAGAKGKTSQVAFKTSGTQSGSIAKMANPGASTREIAKKVRAERCTKGKSGCKPAAKTTSKRERQNKERGEAPAKVGKSSTYRGQNVLGTQVGQGNKGMTGAELGACQNVSGTEYLSQEEFVSHCNTQPQAGPDKISHLQTSRGQVVSGNEVGRSQSVTGDEHGTCSAVTGTDYLPADQSALYCGTENTVADAKKQFSIMSEPSNAGRSKITGGEDYKSQSTTIRPTDAPEKVVRSTTVMGSSTTGTQVGRLENVTGSEYGQCQQVSGTGYQGVEEVQALCQTDPTPVAQKVTMSGTSAGQKVTGDRSGNHNDMTGAEAGSCQAVTGSSYKGAESFQSCSTQQQQQVQQRQRAGVNHSVSGVQPGPEGLTGAQRGACSLVSGSHYQGVDQTSLVCDSAQAAQPGESDYPMLMGQAKSGAYPTAQAQPAPAAEPAGSITGDGWDRGNKVTGTEGPWASQRNTSVRGTSGQSPMGASQYRPVSMEDVQQSPITGSSGNTDVGAKVTLSGGARA